MPAGAFEYKAALNGSWDVSYGANAQPNGSNISLNLAGHIEGKQVSWHKLEETVRLAVRQLDNLIDINVLPIEEARKSDSENRAIGLGVMGFADALEQLGMPFKE